VPEPVSAALRSAGDSAGRLGDRGAAAGPGGVTIEANESQPMNPASTMKLLTTYAALDLLGPALHVAHRGPSPTAPCVATCSRATWSIRGSGDPKLVIESLWLMVQRIRGYGIREIRGDVGARTARPSSRSRTSRATSTASVFRPYNAGPDALLLNFKAVTLGLSCRTREPAARAWSPCRCSPA